MTDSSARIERDTFGSIEVPADRLWGAQTQRSLQYFRISTEKMPAALILALVLVKSAARAVNARARRAAARQGATRSSPPPTRCSPASTTASFRSPSGRPGGTQTNMNVNEVIANRASELLGGPRGEGRLVHPNDDVNRGQSSNDVVPDGDARRRRRARHATLLPALDALRATLEAKAARSPTSSRSAARTCRTRRRSRSARSSPAMWRSSSTRAAHIEATLPHLLRARARRHGGRHRAQRAPGVRRSASRPSSPRAPGLPFVTRAEQVRGARRARRARATRTAR